MVEVSVILPSYNAAPEIKDALRSLSAQTFSDFEVLVIDDGSTDGTVEIVENCGDDRVRLLRRNKSGIASALNHGIRESKGRYIARQDADDLSSPERLLRQYEIMEERDSLALLGTGTIIEYPDGTRRQRHVIESPIRDDLLSGNRFIHGSTMMRADVVSELGGYDEVFEYTEDYDLWLRIAADHLIGNIDEPLYTLRIRNESVYGSVLRNVKLYGAYARMRAKDESTPSLDKSVAEGDVEAVYDTFSRTQKKEFHRNLAMELLRYENPRAAREECQYALTYGSDGLAYGLYALTFAPQSVVESAIGAVRKMKNITAVRRNQQGAAVIDND